MTSVHFDPAAACNRDCVAEMLGLDTVLNLYWRYADELGAARGAQHVLLSNRKMHPKLDDIEAELAYLLIRERRPAKVVEIGTFHGWSTTWLLRALADNGTGHLHSYDIVDHVRRTVSRELAADRWTFHHGDVRTAADLDPSTIDYLFIDAAHTAPFARWYVENLLDKLTLELRCVCTTSTTAPGSAGSARAAS